MERLQRVAALLAQHGQYRMAREVAEISLALKQSAIYDVKTWLALMSSLIARYEQRLEKKHPNIYRLGLFLQALEKVEKDVHSYAHRSDPEALEALKASVSTRFTPSHFPPAADLLRRIDKVLVPVTPAVKESP